MQNAKNVQTLLSMKPMELLMFLENEYIRELPDPNDLNGLAIKLREYANVYAFLSGLESAAKIAVRSDKAGGNKEEYGDAIDRKDVIGNALDTVKMQYAAASRIITVKERIEEEFKMSGKTE
ncbi:MAG: hypothetical protein II399_00340 [Lachnospiraceae bacterium]|nr:hypothetical protein [Lachnospiraceae bacterium]